MWFNCPNQRVRARWTRSSILLSPEKYDLHALTQFSKCGVTNSLNGCRRQLDLGTCGPLKLAYGKPCQCDRLKTRFEVRTGDHPEGSFSLSLLHCGLMPRWAHMARAICSSFHEPLAFVQSQRKIPPYGPLVNIGHVPFDSLSVYCP